MVDLLAAAGGAERIAALELDGVASLPRRIGQTPVDRVLTDPGAAGAPAGEDAFGVAAGAIEDTHADRLVVEDDIGALQSLQRPQGQQIGVARAGADQKDRPGMAVPIVGPLAGAREGGL